MKKLVLVDASSYLFRAYHALPDLRNRKGLPTGAIYGVINMLRRLQREGGADYSACVFDPRGKTFREDWYPEYKANRAAMPEDLAVQIEPLFECIRALGWPLIVVDGVEADDVIGTLARHAEQAGLRTEISTGDKDLTQLVSPQVALVNTMTNEHLDEAGVRGKFGVPPERIVDYLALIGDAVDNVPGVPKVGPKTAVKWLEQYGSLDEVMAHAGDIGGVVGENLRNSLDWLPTARRLVTVQRDVELPVEVEQLVVAEPDTQRLRELFADLDFRSWLAELGRADEPAAEASPAHERHYETLLDEADLKRWLELLQSAELVSVDTETTSLDPLQARLVGMSFAVEAHHAAYLPLAHHYAGVPAQIGVEAALALLRPWLEDAAPRKLGQHLKYDRHVLANHGVQLAGVAHDTLLQSYVLESHKRHDMDSLAERCLGVKTIKYEEVCGKGASQIGFEQVSVERATEYAAEDADITLQLHMHLHPRLAREPRLEEVYSRIEMPLVDVLFRMERHGVLLDTRLLRDQGRELGEQMMRLEQEAHALAGQPFNLNSPKQIQEILFGKLGLPVIKKTATGVPSTDEEVLEQLARDYPLPKRLLDYRGLAKLKSTYTDKLPQQVNPATGRVHTNYSQAVAVTGRLSSSDPNLQNIPVRTAEGRRIREAFIAPPGHALVSADYSQIELRIMAHISGDAGLLSAFEQGLDIHAATAAEIFGAPPGEVSSDQRRYAKVINFGLIYGMSAFGLAGQLGIERSAAQQYMDRYFARYPGVAEYMQRTREEARSRGWVETVFGRRLWLPEIGSSSPGRRQAAERAAINAPMQGTAADLIKLAMIAVQGWIERERLATRLIMQVHDELVLEVPDAELARVHDELPGLMTGVAQLRVPLQVSVGTGPNWEQAH